jgi:hypothetical protein
MEQKDVKSRTVTLSTGMVVPREVIEDLKARRIFDGTGSIVTLYQDSRMGGIDADRRCPNCGGPHGEGLIGAATGDKCSAYYFGHYITVSRTDVDGEPVHHQEMAVLRRKVVWYPCPICSGTERKRFLIDRSGLAELWDEIDPRIYAIEGRESFNDVINRTAAKWTTGNPTGWITIIGPYGSGKTAAGMAIVKRAIMTGVEAQFVEASTLFRAVEETYGGFDLDDAQTALSRWRNTPILVVDELDWKNTRKSSGDMLRAAEEVITMLNDRYRNQRATAIISPLDWWEVAFDGIPRLNPNLGSDWKAVLSRATEGEIALTQVSDQRREIGEVRRTIESEVPEINMEEL